MTEDEWLECNDPIRMLSYRRADGNDRKTLLFIIACMVRIWDRITEEGHEWVEAAERVAEGIVDRMELAYHYDEVGESALEYAYSAASPVEKGIVYAVMEVFYGVWYSPANIGGTELGDAGVRPREEEKQVQARLLRDIFGNPFRPVTINPAWRTPAATNLPAVAYEERSLPSGELDPIRLAILGDALEEAGCDNADILNHLRGPGPHVRGCWVVDFLLEKE
jgi:hypothetical protein